MLKIRILKVENPSCLWGRVISGQPGDTETTEQYNKLQSQMNLFYQDVTQDLRKLKPTSLDVGQVCVVYWSRMKLWCRAVVESVIQDSVSCQVCCLLVDHGERLLVPSIQIRVAVKNFLQLPFWVRRFHLAQVKPTTLRVPVCEDKAQLMPSTKWDSSATLYLHNLLRASAQAQAVLLESECESTSIELYLTIGNIKICVNDDLVAKKFAYYSKESADGSILDKDDQLSLMLSTSILTQSVSMTSSKQTEQTQLPPVMSHDLALAGAAPFALQSHQHEVETFNGDCTPKVPEETLPAGSQSEHSSDAATVNDSSEDTDSSLAAALTKNLSLFRFLKFMNPGCSYQQAALNVSEMICLISSDRRGAAGFLKRSDAEHLADEETSSSDTSVELGTAKAGKTWKNEENSVCSRLLEWLNPDPLRSSPDPADDTIQVVPCDPRESGIVVHSALPVEPCTSLDDAPITDAIRWVLRRKQYNTLSPADRYSWPAVARGCNTVVVSHSADQPLSYFAPLLTHILLNSVFSSFTSMTGPIAVVLCPRWEKVQAVYDLLEERKVAQILHPIMMLLGVGKDEAKAVKIPQKCLLLVTTPFSLVRLLSSQCFMLLRLYHLVLDEADQLFTLAPDQMATILQHFQKVTSSEEKASCPQQIVAVAKHWTSHMEGLLASHMPYPCIVITAPEEAALYGNVQQIILMTEENNKTSVLLGALDFNPDVGQKTLIIAHSAQEVEDVFKAVNNKSVFCLKTHEGLADQFDLVIQQWRKDIGPGTQVILVTTNECLRCLGIRDATCVVHYEFPTSPKLFGSRLFCMAENFRNLSQQDQAERSHLPTSVLLISERNSPHVVGLLRYLERTDAALPAELLSFAQGIHEAREDQKISRPLCRYLKSFGVCRENRVCPDRHRFISRLDRSELPAAGVIEVVPLHIKTASVFYGRIAKKGDSGFDNMLSEMASYYRDKKPGAEDFVEGGLYAVQEGDIFHRVKVLSVPARGDRLFFNVLVQFIDVGKEEVVKSHQILQLPEQFHTLPSQAVEIIIGRVKPVDAEADWHPKTSRAISQKIRGLQHRARVVLSLGNTVFVDPMIRVTQVPGIKTVINEYSVQSEILNTGMGVRNPEHLDLLKALCKGGEPSSCREAGHDSELGGRSMSLEVRIKAEEVVLAGAFRAAEVKKLTEPPQLESCESLSPESSTNQSAEPAGPELCPVPLGNHEALSDMWAVNEQRNSHTPDLKSKHIMRNGDGAEICPTTSLNTRRSPSENGLLADEQQGSSKHINISTNGTNDNSATSFHPLVRWYQTTDSVIVTVKLTNPEDQSCDFYPDRVVYRGRVNRRSYKADLQLQANIAADRCRWEVQSNEPVLKLAKQQQGHWQKLVRNKNIFVTYDMEHFEEDEDKPPNGQWFVEDTGEENWYVDSESSSESD
ncbi:putative ATP-dependent RNA helicase TDRD12 [Channa argus]|uniref:putative ATP-dependent RNA helicase TDRD12 n=1 Tax=Channa argus TaxID=215402 RepID=UPI0035216DC9